MSFASCAPTTSCIIAACPLTRPPRGATSTVVTPPARAAGTSTDAGLKPSHTRNAE